jgi:hypothetical protein
MEVGQMADTTTVNFSVKGGFEVSNKLKPEYDAMGLVCGYLDENGFTYRLMMSIEIEGPMGGHDVISTDKDLADHGFTCLDYSELTFFPEG